MRKVMRGIVTPISRSNLKKLIKLHGLQSWMFDENLLFFEWDGLEYQFYIYDNDIFLEKINLQRDVVLANLEDFKTNIRSTKSKPPIDLD